MSSVNTQVAVSLVHEEIQSHDAWYGNISGLKAERMLRGHKKPYLYMLRKGENETETSVDYYVSFTLPDGGIKHQPFVITLTSDGWEWANYNTGTCDRDASIEDVLHLMMHCEKPQIAPLSRLQER